MKQYGRLEGVEVLRGFAATGVIFFHTWSRAILQHQDQLIDRVLSYFAMGVPLFFAISAFSLLYGYHNRIYDEYSLKRFYIRRFFRIAPLFYVLFLVYVIYAWYGWGRVYTWHEILANLTFTYQMIPSQYQSIVWAGWTIGIEWIFYMMFPLIAMISRSRTLTIALFVAFLIVSINFSPLTAKISAVDPQAGYMNTMKHMVYFFLGVVMFRLLPQIEIIRNKYQFISKFDILIVPAVAYFFVKSHLVISKDLASVISFAALIVLAVIGYSIIFNNPFTRMLGKLSYSLYLTNPIIIHALEKFGAYQFIVNHVDGFRIAFLLCCILSFVCVVLASLATYYLIEQPGIRLGQKFIDNMKIKRREGTLSKSNPVS